MTLRRRLTSPDTALDTLTTLWILRILMSMTHRFIKMWVIIVGGCIAGGVAVALPFVLRGDDTPAAIAVNSAVALMGLCVVLLVGGWLIYRTWLPPALRQAHADGLSASATVLEVTSTGWRVRGLPSGKRDGQLVWQVRQGGLSKSSTYRSHEYKVRLQVSHPNMPTYEAVTFQVLTADQVPKLGETVMVRVHPQNADMVVMQKDSLGQA